MIPNAMFTKNIWQNVYALYAKTLQNFREGLISRLNTKILFNPKKMMNVQHEKFLKILQKEPVLR